MKNTTLCRVNLQYQIIDPLMEASNKRKELAKRQLENTSNHKPY